ncbi:YggS family pyridoxal phosphate-dependent enzyme [Mesosutterella sp. AGMB02718]|uniref:Pyridoxal phosphate homeostasis protein n=2 Tax=Mesosutterella TaxID=2494213 RepID=A0ABT7IJB6_9BURK|nr:MULTISPECIES: YggS family pyridoxal phosphate-dependent enzyme [unclassified Mesosutterella]MDL2058460.1 YggS family pyridoxal phosphate-dependent enzyme [Mesosutterella sp. AGMB02718]
MSVLLPGIEGRIRSIQERMKAACERSSRGPGEVRLLAVSKTFPASAVEEAAAAGLRAFGENYAQEGCEKVDWFRENRPGLKLEWHFIGPLQSNKTRMVAERFDWVQSVNRMKIARRLSEQRPQDLPDLNVLVEVNIDGEASKSGLAPQEAVAFALEASKLPRLRVRGFMAIPAPASDPASQAGPFKAMRSLFLSAQEAGLPVDTLSMGMSGDFEEAIACGSTMVRIGSAIFGPRDYGPGH